MKTFAIVNTYQEQIGVYLIRAEDKESALKRYCKLDGFQENNVELYPDDISIEEVDLSQEFVQVYSDC